MSLPPTQPDGFPSRSGGEAGPGALAPGTRIGRFRIQGLQGAGGMGAVYEAWDPVLERKVALKAVRLGGAGHEEAMARFRREAMALAQLNHPNVCQVHDWVESKDGAYIAMEFVEGATLDAAGADLDLRGKLQVLRAIARALEAAHAKGIVHRDLKPSNVMVDALGHVKVLDFGLARLADAGQALDVPEPTSPVPVWPLCSGDDCTQMEVSDGPAGADMTQAGVFMGTPSHASPEQATGQRVGPPSDVFSLGLVAWELLLGEPPFAGEGRERLRAILREEPRSMRLRLPRRVARLLRAMLRKDPSRRPTATEVAAVLGRQLGGAPLAWWIGGAALLLVVTLGAGYLLFGRGIIADLSRDHPPRLVVLPIRNETGDASLDALVNVGMTELMAGALRAAPNLSVVEPETVLKAMAGLHMAASGNPPRGTGPRIAKALGARLLLRGTVSRDPAHTGLMFSYELVDAAGRVRLSGSGVGPRAPSFDPHTLVDPAAHRILRKVAPLASAASPAVEVPPAVFAAYATGEARFLVGDFKGSEPLLRQAAMEAPGYASAVASYAACLRHLGADAAPLAANWALMSAQATGDRWAEVRALALKAYLAKDRGDLDGSQALREQSLALARSIGDTDGAIAAINHLGLLAAERGRDAQAQAYYEQALALARQAGDRILQPLIQNNLANLALEQGRASVAAVLYQDTFAVQEELGSPWGEALALNNLGIVALMSRDLPRAGTLLSRSMAIRESVGDTAGEATCMRNLGILALMQGDPALAAARQTQAMALARKAGLRTIEAECQFYRADLDRLQGRFRQAQEGYRNVLALLPVGVTPEVRDNAQAGLAECLVRQSHPDLAKARRLLAAIRPSDAGSPIVLRAQAWMAHASGQPAQAVAYLDKAILDPQREAPQIRSELEAARAMFLQGRR